MIGRARERHGLYYLETPSQLNMTKGKLSHSFISECVPSYRERIQLLHSHLGHPSFRIIALMFPSLFTNLAAENFHCEVCELAKHRRVPSLISNKRSPIPFYLVHSDIWGPSIVSNVSRARWSVSFIDDCTQVTWIFLLKHKSDVSIVLSNFCSMIQTQFGVTIKRFRSDNARDYFNHILTPYFQKERIIHESSCVNIPQQNGVTERKNSHPLEKT